MSIVAARRIFIGLLLFGLAILSTACAGVPPVVKVGLVAPFEGRNRYIGYDVIYSARLAVRQTNEMQRLGRYRLTLVTLDDSGTIAGARHAATTLIADPAVVAVIGHGVPATSAAAAPLYAAAGVPFIDLTQPALAPVPVENLPEHFQAAYTAVTPFGETAGPFAAPAYDAFSLLLEALAREIDAGRRPTRENLATTLTDLSVRGITGQMVPGK